MLFLIPYWTTWYSTGTVDTISPFYSTVEPLYNEVLGTMKITLLYQVSHYIRVKKQRNIKSWDQQNYLVIRGFCYIRPRYNEVPLYLHLLVAVCHHRRTMQSPIAWCVPGRTQCESHSESNGQKNIVHVNEFWILISWGIFCEES